MNFLFIFYFIGLVFAVYQDFTRREIDDWLNLFLFFGGILFLSISYNLFYNINNLISFGFFIFIVCLFSLGFYYGRFFSGGDSKLFFALSPMIYNVFLEVSLSNLLFFIFFLFAGGSVYSLIYSFIIFARDFKRTKVVFVNELKKIYNVFIICFAVILLFAGLFKETFFILGFLILLFVLLICVAKSLDKISMKKIVNTRDLREGDWLFSDIKVGKKIFKKSWDGLSFNDVKYLKKFNKKVFVKEGIPYAPSFLFALLLFVFRDYLWGIIFS